MIRYMGLVASVTLFASPLSAAPVPKEKGLPEETIEAWTKRGGVLTWEGQRSSGEWAGELDRRGLSNSHPRWLFNSTSADLKGLPPMDRPFGLYFVNGHFPAELFKDLPDPKNLVSIRFAETGKDGLQLRVHLAVRGDGKNRNLQFCKVGV